MTFFTYRKVPLFVRLKDLVLIELLRTPGFPRRSIVRLMSVVLHMSPLKISTLIQCVPTVPICHPKGKKPFLDVAIKWLSISSYISCSSRLRISSRKKRVGATILVLLPFLNSLLIKCYMIRRWKMLVKNCFLLCSHGQIIISNVNLV